MSRVTSTFLILSLIALFLNSCQKKQKYDLTYRTLFNQADAEYKNLDYTKSSETLLELLLLADQVSATTDNKKIHLKSLTYLGAIFKKIGEKKLALQHFEDVLKLAEVYNNEAYQVQALLKMAELEDDPYEVEQILKKTNQKFKANKENEYSFAQIKYALALVYAKNERIEDALQLFNELLKNNYNDKLKSYIYKGLGIAYRNDKNFKSAVESFDTALEYSIGIDKSHELNINVEKADLFLMSKQFRELNILIKKIQPEVDSSNDLYLIKRIYELRLEIYNQTDNITGQMEILTELLSLNEKIYKKSNAALGSIAVNLKNFELKKENITQKEINSQLKISLALASLLFLSVILFFILFHRLYRNKTKIKILEKEKELISESTNAYMNGQEEERKQHAAQLHDSLGANLAAVNMHLSLLRKEVPAQKYDRISGMLKNVITETRNISHNIMPPLLVNQGVIAAITEKTLEWTCPALQFEIVSNTEKVNLDSNLEIALYRGILECMSNTMNKAGASEALITFKQLENDSLHITIKDNGHGFDVGILARGEGGLGLNGLKNRIIYFKGDFAVASQIGKGTTIQINVPLIRMKKTG